MSNGQEDIQIFLFYWTKLEGAFNFVPSILRAVSYKIIIDQQLFYNEVTSSRNVSNKETIYSRDCLWSSLSYKN